MVEKKVEQSDKTTAPRLVLQMVELKVQKPAGMMVQNLVVLK